MNGTQEAELPRGWVRTTLGEIGEYLNGRGFKKSEWSQQGRMIIRIQDLTGTGDSPNYFEGEAEPRHEVRPGDLLISWAATLGAYIWNGPDAVLNQHIFKVESYIDKRFHYYLVTGVIGDLYRQAHGSGMVHITKGRFESTPVPLPPLPEQVRIVGAIEEQLSRIEAGIAGLQRVQANLKRYRAAILKAACEGRLVPTEAELARKEGREYEPADVLLERILAERRARWETEEMARLTARGKAPRGGEWKQRCADPDLAASAELPQLPTGWTWTFLSAIADLKGGITKGQRRREGDEVRSVPYLRVANVQRGFLDLSEVKEIDAPQTKIRELLLRPGDVLFNEGGDRDKLGRGWVWKGEIPECIHQNHVFRARLYTEDVHPKFLSWYGNSLAQRYFMEEGKQTTNLASINLTKLGALPVPLPPRAEQERIVAEVELRLSALDTLEATVDLDLRRADRLRRAVLKRAFEGKLVPQDRSDEPASALLERVRAERQTSPKAKKRTTATAASG